MAQGTFYKTFGSSDRTTTRTLLHEAIPVTGTIVASGSHSPYSGSNAREYSHGMFQSIYDYPYLSSSANHLFDISVGVHSGAFNGDFDYLKLTKQKDKKGNIYEQMSQVLMGYDLTGSARPFDTDGNLDGGPKMNSVFFINFSRLLTKDEIKKGSFNMDIAVDNPSAANREKGIYDHKIRLTDISGSNGYFVNSPAGEYGVVNATRRDANSTKALADSKPVGLLFYQAGVLVLTASLIKDRTDGTITYTQTHKNDDDFYLKNLITGSTISMAANALRNRITHLSFNNTTELNSTVYFCRANHNEFNYSSNPTYLNGSKIIVKDNDIMVPPRSYVTTVGLYSADNELLAVAKLSEPLRKDPTNELTLRVRLDY